MKSLEKFMLIKEEYKRGVELACEQAFKLLKNSLVLLSSRVILIPFL